MGLQEGFFRCQKREYIQIISRSECSVHAAPGLKRAPRTREISTWKSVLPATRFSPASRSWSIRQGGWSISPQVCRVRRRQGGSRVQVGAVGLSSKASGDGGLCCVGALWMKKSLHEEELGQSARKQHARLGTGSGVVNWRGGGGSGNGAGAHGRSDRYRLSPLHPQRQHVSGTARRRPAPGGTPSAISSPAAG